MSLDDTIVAISTPIGKSGIGIVRLSGKDALSIAERIFVNSNGLRPLQFPSHTLHYGWIVNRSQASSRKLKVASRKLQATGIIDEVLLTVMRGPRTYTREDTVEINCHSGIVVLKRILELVLKAGGRLAEPGEFTKRAYLNGRIDLTQAEAVLDVINSQTQGALNVALGQLQGRFSQQINGLLSKLLGISTQLEASIDFSDQDIKTESLETLLKKMQGVAQDLKKLLDTADKGLILRQGISCVICGKPNVGKSSLLNALLKKDRAIVTPIPGTTRDILEESIDLKGIPLRLIDTAGIVAGKDAVEKEAVRRAQRCVKEADLALLVLDASKGLTSDDLRLARALPQGLFLVVLNKQDLPVKITLAEAEKILPGTKVLSVSALYGTGLDRLEGEIAQFIWQGKSNPLSDILVTNIRHKEALKRAQRGIRRSVKAVQDGQGVEIIVMEIQEAQRSLAEIIGHNTNCQEMLERIFAQFCIGK